LLVIGWGVAFISYIIQRRKKKIRRKKVAAGVKPPKPAPQPPEKYLIPPDPAVVLGQRQPGEHVIMQSKNNKHRNGKLVKHSVTMPEFYEMRGEGSDKPYGQLVHSGSEHAGAIH